MFYRSVTSERHTYLKECNSGVPTVVSHICPLANSCGLICTEDGSHYHDKLLMCVSMTPNMQQKPHLIQYRYVFNEIVLVLKELQNCTTSSVWSSVSHPICLRAGWCVALPCLCSCLVTRARTDVAGFLSVCWPHTPHVCLDTQPSAHTQPWPFPTEIGGEEGGSRGDKGGGQRWQEERGVEFENRVKEGHQVPGILHRAKMWTLIK